jgi:NAD(P)-dependent dehydrogenase (short-subunit alcohol dehydrogenase family)
MDLQLSGSRVLVTGGTRGIGRAIVETFVDEGAVVEFCARSAPEIEATEKALAERGASGRATGVRLDVRDGPALTRWVEEAAGRLGGLDVVVANVSALAAQDTEENWQASFEVDLMHTVRLSKAAIPYLEASGTGSIVAISSVSGREADFAAGPYGTMKTAIVGYVSGLALQLAGRGVRANVVSPGNTYFDDGFWQNIERTVPELFSTALGLNPTGRMGRPEEMARAVVFLASPLSSFTTGTNLVVDGALTRGIQL